MRTRRRPPSRIPTVDLVPMMDVLMTVLIFFVVVSMGLTGIQLNGVILPRSVNGTDPASTESQEAPPLAVGLTDQGKLVLNGEPTNLTALTPAIQTYFAENPNGSVLLKADRALPYDDIAALLIELRKVGGRRVSLAVE
jgi:biopolymer transport protein ExbD